MVFPFFRKDKKIRYALFRRADSGAWQGISGGGEEGEMPVDTARREAAEEASIPADADYIRLASIATTPAVNICGLKWGDDMPVIPEYAFGAEVPSEEMKPSHEHTEYKWFEFKEAAAALKWDSNRNALWELNHRLEHGRTDSAVNIDNIRRFL